MTDEEALTFLSFGLFDVGPLRQIVRRDEEKKCGEGEKNPTLLAIPGIPFAIFYLTWGRLP